MKDGILQSIVPFYIYYNIINIILTKGDVSVHAFLIEKIVVGFFFSLADTNHLQVLQHYQTLCGWTQSFIHLLVKTLV